jgi:hypothetical protein
MRVTDTLLQELTISMYGKRYVLNPAEDLELHPSSVGDHLQEQASRFAFYATVRDMCLAKVDSCQSQLAVVEARLSEEFRSGIIQLAKTTEDAVKQAIRGHEAYVDAKETLSLATVEYDQLNSIAKAFEHRREMLVELSKRANNTTWNDKDIDPEVSATITPLQSQKNATKGMGTHPGKVKQ